ncbi:MAG: ATP-dependent DNA helicase [Caldilineaceae bacterium]|nr:ATP-dependent DNA helicase [Caldilineaceae bacterium]MBP9074985.1 ATP-dependent DNA helicase [Caldilineaceae bacterium]
MDEPIFLDPPPPSQPRPKDGPDPLEAVDLAHFFGPDGPLAATLPGYELRASQLQMAEAVKQALLDNTTALIEAPTGTGKSIAYLLPAILSGRTVVVATANKSLQSQLYTKDIPFLRKVLNRDIQAVLIKGRSNYLCTHKWTQEANEQQLLGFMDQNHQQISFVKKWLEETETGDVDDLPFVLAPDLRSRVVSFPDDCLHKDCVYLDDHCWIEQMRDRAAEAQVLITNHHLLLNALELGWGGTRILPPAAIYVVDEAHQLEETATAVFETTVTDFTVEQLLARAIIKEYADESELDELRFQNTVAFQEVAYQSRENSYRIKGTLEEMKRLGHDLEALKAKLKQLDPFKQFEKETLGGSGTGGGKDKGISEEMAAKRGQFEKGLESLASVANKLLVVASDKRDDSYVRFATRVFNRRKITLEVHAAPIAPSALLRDYLFDPDPTTLPEDGLRTVICTSATLSTNGRFEHFKNRCGVVAESPTEAKTPPKPPIELIVPSVFDYPHQALLYQPALPAYDWKNKDAFYIAASAEIRRLLEVSRGRALCLFTSWGGLQAVNQHLSDPDTGIVWPLRAQGDAPRDALLRWFRETPHSVLLATKSFWEGVDIPGDDLSLVILDKMPFPTPSDPLHAARMESIDAGEERASFAEYMVPLMTLALKQGFGRLIRRTTDRGVVAILDERLSSKGYGRRARTDLPPARFSREIGEIHRFFRAALDSQADFALNVSTSEGEQPQWRWELVRLQDGRGDGKTGRLEIDDGETDQAVVAELTGIFEGLRDLRRRIEQAGRAPEQFGVEVRCSQPTLDALAQPESGTDLISAVVAESVRWRNIHLIGLTPGELSAAESVGFEPDLALEE